MSEVTELAERLRALEAPEDLWTLSNGCLEIVRSSGRPGGALLAAGLVLGALARELDGEYIEEIDWQALKPLIDATADLVEITEEPGELTKVASAWSRRRTRPSVN